MHQVINPCYKHRVIKTFLVYLKCRYHCNTLIHFLEGLQQIIKFGGLILKLLILCTTLRTLLDFCLKQLITSIRIILIWKLKWNLIHLITCKPYTMKQLLVHLLYSCLTVQLLHLLIR